MPTNKKFIFVTGHPRSGTTFVGKVMSLPKNVQYLSEPFNPTYGHKSINSYFIYINNKNKDPITIDARNIIDSFLNHSAKFKKLDIKKSKTTKQKIGRIIFGNKNNAEFLNFKYNPIVNTAVIKDPTLVLATDYMQYKKIPTLFLLRHPAATVASCKRLNMNHNVSRLKDQPALESAVKVYEKEFNLKKLNNIQNNALHWLFINKLVLNENNLNSNNLVIKKHEDISLDPKKEFKSIFDLFGIKYTKGIENYILEYTSSKNPTYAPNNAMHHFHRDSKVNIKGFRNILTNKEIQQIKEITYEFASKFYDDDSWL